MTTWLQALTKPSVTNEPPARRDQWPIDIAVIITVVIALFLGFGIRNSASHASRSVKLGEGLPTIKIPDNWITGKSEGALLEASDPGSPSAFKAELTVTTRPLAAGEDAIAAHAATGLQRTQQLQNYRELKSTPVTLSGKTTGILVTYSYIADPTRDQGAMSPPVVVKAQDLIFPSGDSQALIVTIATDASTWDKEQASVGLIQDSLGMKIQPPAVITVEAQEGGK